MPKVKLTKRAIDAAEHDGRGNQTFYRDTELPGLMLRVTRGGAKSFVIEYRKGGRQRRMTLGKYGKLTIEKARKRAQSEFGAVADGDDPAERKRLEREGDTLADVAAGYLEDLKRRAETGSRRLSGWEGAKGLWDRHVPASLKRLKVADVTAADVERVHASLADKPATADHVKTVLHAVLKRAVKRRLIDSNPAASVERYKPSPKRRRPVTLEELGALGQVLDDVEAGRKVEVVDEDGEKKTYDVDAAAALTLRLLVLTGMRRSELLGHHAKARRGPREGLRWSDVDLEGATYELVAHGGGSGAKGGEPRTLPLGAATVELLRGVRPDDVDPEAPVVPSPRDASKPYNGLNKARRRIYAAAGIEGKDAHSLRHTFESIAFDVDPGRAGALTGRALTRDAILNQYIHVDLPKLRAVADIVADRIARALAGELLADVVPIERAR